MHFLLASLDERIIQWISHGGYAVLFGLLFACGLGLPLPEDIPLLAAGVMVQQGRFNLLIAAICAWCGIIGGDCVLYHLGKALGAGVSKLPVIGRHVDAEKLARVEKRFDKWGVWVVAVGRLFAGIRGAMVVCAGAIKFPFWKFLIADGLAAIVSGGIFLGLGYWFADRLPWLEKQVHYVKGWVGKGLIVVLIGLAIWGWFHWKKMRQTKRPGFLIKDSPANAANLRPTPAAPDHAAD